MPELPEVEIVARGLRKLIVGKTISSVTVNAPKTTTFVSPTFGPKDFSSVLTGRRITKVARHGKNILIHLSGSVTLWAHLKMTGHFFVQKRTDTLQKHDLVVFEFTDSKRTGTHLRFNDYRRFGRLRLFPNDELWQQNGLRNIGPEPLTLTAEKFIDLCRRRPRQLKAALMDQSFIAGIGNIYADEALHAAKLHPRTLTSSVSPKKLRELLGHIQRLLRWAITLKGSSVGSYTNVMGKTGGFQKKLLAYGQEGRQCTFCKIDIVREKIGSRSAHFCPRCQRIKA